MQHAEGSLVGDPFASTRAGTGRLRSGTTAAPARMALPSTTMHITPPTHQPSNTYPYNDPFNSHQSNYMTDFLDTTRHPATTTAAPPTHSTAYHSQPVQQRSSLHTPQHAAPTATAPRRYEPRVNIQASSNTPYNATGSGRGQYAGPGVINSANAHLPTAPQATSGGVGGGFDFGGVHPGHNAGQHATMGNAPGAYGSTMPLPSNTTRSSFNSSFRR